MKHKIRKSKQNKTSKRQEISYFAEDDSSAITNKEQKVKDYLKADNTYNNNNHSRGSESFELSIINYWKPLQFSRAKHFV